MRDEVVDRFFDFLQNIEFAILGVYDDDKTLLDLDVIDALDALVRRYAAEEQNRTPPGLRLSDRARRVYLAVERVCDWRLGRTPLNEGEIEPPVPAEVSYTIADILLCLKRIRKSVKLWNEQGGRQGYLDYVSEFINR
ncbi:MAG: hypothetical protein ACRD3J_31210 [Thermoanaerobaculia bacterium]